MPKYGESMDAYVWRNVLGIRPEPKIVPCFCCDADSKPGHLYCIDCRKHVLRGRKLCKKGGD